MKNVNRAYTDGLRGNQDIFLADVMNSPEFVKIKNEYLPKPRYFTGIHHLLSKLSDDPTSRAIEKCADKISETFRLRRDIAIRLLISHNYTLPIDLSYLPKITSDENYVYLRIGPKTSQKDVMGVWKLVKEEQRKLGRIGSKTSINPELAFCIHRELVITGKSLKSIFADYQHGKLNGYEHKATIDDFDDFRKYYKRSTTGLLIK